MLSTLFLSRIQFAITITFHILFPAFSIGLATYILITEALWLKTNNRTYYRSVRFWSKILALTFGMGIISGLAMQFQIGTNWGGFSKTVGPVLGVLFTLEALTAFFIEATFLGVMLFGWHYVPKKIHFLATFMVFLGVSLSAFWILAANSWMQTPAGVTFSKGKFIVTSWHKVIFNHSTIVRYIHMMFASYLSTAFIIMAVASTYLIKNKHIRFAKSNIKIACSIIALCIPLQMIVGDEVGYDVHEFQPIKTAAIEANWHTITGAPLILFANINQEKEHNTLALKIPYIASILNTHSIHGKLIGLNTVARSNQPDVWITFYSFRIMVGLGIIMLLLALVTSYKLITKRFWHCRWLQKAYIACAPIGFIALITGWYTAETGRQPWVVYNYLRTSQGVSNVSADRVLLGFLVILVVYGLVFGLGYMSYFFKTVAKGPIIKARKRIKSS